MPNLTSVSYTIIALICLLGIADQWAETVFPWWRLALAVYLIALVYEWSRSRLVPIGATTVEDKPLRLGRNTSLALQFTNFGPMTLHLTYAVDLPPILEASRAARQVTVAPFNTTLAPISVQPQEVGTDIWTSLPVRLLGPLRLGHWQRTIELDTKLRVIPDSLTRIEQTSGLNRTGSTTQQRPHGGHELHHLRQYRPGDPRHTIDWKASAKTGQLVTRVFGEDQHLEIMLILDAGRSSRNRIDGLSQLGHYINLAARFAEQAVANEDRIGMIAVTDRPVAVVPPGRGFKAVTIIREALTNLKTEPVESDMLAAAREMGRIVRHRCLVVVLTDFYGADPTGRLNQSVRLWTPQHLPMVVGLVGAELKQIAGQTAREWLDPYISLAAENYQQDLHRGMQSLRQLGAQTLLARPRDLEQRVFTHYQRLKIQRRI